MIVVPFNSARAFVALGSWLVDGTKYVCRQGLLRIDLLLTAVGVEKRGRIFSWSSFYSGRHVTPRGCWYSVEQNHQFLNKFLHMKKPGRVFWGLQSKIAAASKISFFYECKWTSLQDWNQSCDYIEKCVVSFVFFPATWRFRDDSPIADCFRG